MPQSIGDDKNARPLRLFIVAGEHSGDQLGGKLMAALKARAGVVEFSGVGGESMQAEGLLSLFPLSDVAVMGPIAIARALPRLINRVYRSIDAAIDTQPDALIIIDSPEFTHPIARHLRAQFPHMPIINYVSPSIWAWRPGRARKMTPYVDHVLALLPFEPAEHIRHGGPACDYVGHPLVERRDWISIQDPKALSLRLGLDASRQVLVVLPGSRVSEVTRLMKPFGEAVAHLIAAHGPLEVIIPVVPHVRHLVEQQLADWPVRPHLIEGEEDKFAAFRLARAALAASGTVTLELAVAGCPMVVAYKVDGVAVLLRSLVKVHSIVLPNLVLGENVFPEFIQEQCRSEILAEAVLPLLSDTPEAARQIAALEKIPALMAPPAGTPSASAAEIILKIVR